MHLQYNNKTLYVSHSATTGYSCGQKQQRGWRVQNHLFFQLHFLHVFRKNKIKHTIVTDTNCRKVDLHFY